MTFHPGHLSGEIQVEATTSGIRAFTPDTLQRSLADEGLRPGPVVSLPSGETASTQSAYYDPRHGELRFGSFDTASTVSGRNVPGGKISLVLSHDVVVHEMSHAMLDGLRSHILHPSNLDVLAFHEGFADLIALFQRFTYKEIVGRATRPQLRSSAGTRALSRGLKDTVEAAAAECYLVRPGESRPWLSALKASLQRCMEDCPALDASDLYDLTTVQAIQRLQTASRASVDGIIGPSTPMIIGGRFRSRNAVPSDTGAVPRWVARLMENDPAAMRPRRLEGLDIGGAIDMAEYSFGALAPNQRSGLTGLLRALAADPAISDLRWGAYMLATVKHECAGAWQPIEEYGKGSGRAYGHAVSVRGETGRPVRNAYYGRGYVQLTWRENYLAMGMRLGIGRTLEIHPELALDPDIAYRIMSGGMRNGVFTGRALDRFINAKGADYLNARRTVNGLDQAAVIEGYANRFESILLACS